MVKRNKPEIIALLEPKVQLDAYETRRKLRFDNIFANVSGKIWVCWQDSIKLAIK